VVASRHHAGLSAGGGLHALGRTAHRAAVQPRRLILVGTGLTFAALTCFGKMTARC